MYPKLHFPLSVAISIDLLNKSTSIVSDSSIRYSAVIPFISPIFCSYKILNSFNLLGVFSLSIYLLILFVLLNTVLLSS